MLQSNEHWPTGSKLGPAWGFLGFKIEEEIQRCVCFYGCRNQNVEHIHLNHIRDHLPILHCHAFLMHLGCHWLLVDCGAHSAEIARSTVAHRIALLWPRVLLDMSWFWMERLTRLAASREHATICSRSSGRQKTPGNLWTSASSGNELHTVANCASHASASCLDHHRFWMKQSLNTLMRPYVFYCWLGEWSSSAFSHANCISRRRQNVWGVFNSGTSICGLRDPRLELWRKPECCAPK